MEDMKAALHLACGVLRQTNYMEPHVSTYLVVGGEVGRVCNGWQSFQCVYMWCSKGPGTCSRASSRLFDPLTTVFCSNRHLLRATANFLRAPVHLSNHTPRRLTHNRARCVRTWTPTRSQCWTQSWPQRRWRQRRLQQCTTSSSST